MIKKSFVVHGDSFIIARSGLAVKQRHIVYLRTRSIEHYFDTHVIPPNNPLGRLVKKHGTVTAGEGRKIYNYEAPKG
jgi:hypothetical protein